MSASAPQPSVLMEAWLASEETRLERTTLIARKSNVKRVIGALGDDFRAWDAFWAWCASAQTRKGEPMSAGTKRTTAEAVLQMLAWARRAGSPWSHVGFVVTESEKPSGLSVRQKREANPMGDEDTNGSPFAVPEVRSILRSAQAPNVPTYMRLGIMLGAFHAMNPSDGNNLLSGKGRFIDRTNDPKGNLGLWYLCGRQKTNTRTFIPLATPVVEALSPFHTTHADGSIAIDIGQRIPSHKHWRDRFAQVRESAGVKYVAGEEAKRFRNTFRHEMKDVLGVPDAVTKCLMAHRIKVGSDIGTSYDSVEPQQMVSAMLKWTAVLAPVAAVVEVA